MRVESFADKKENAQRGIQTYEQGNSLNLNYIAHAYKVLRSTADKFSSTSIKTEETLLIQ